MSTEQDRAQFIKRPMVLFDDLSANRAHPYIWLLCEYVTRWTVNWFNSPEVLLSADEFMHGRRKPGSKERYDGGLPIDSRTSVLRYLKQAVEGGYLQERETWDSLGRKAYSLPSWYHPDTCTQYEQVSSEQPKPVHEMDRTSPPNEQGVHRVYRSSTPDVQVDTPQPAPEQSRELPIETSIQTFHKDKIETLPSVVKSENEEEKTEDAPTPEEQQRAAEQKAERDREAARRRQLAEEARERRDAIEAIKKEQTTRFEKLMALKTQQRYLDKDGNEWSKLQAEWVELNEVFQRVEQQKKELEG